MDMVQAIATDLQVQPKQVAAAISLLDEGCTVPFIARYRKEATFGLDDTQLRGLSERLQYRRELEDRRATVLKSIQEQDKLTPALKSAIHAADNKTALEDLYLPYKPKRRTKAQLAREAGLQPLADALLTDFQLDPDAVAQTYCTAEHNIPDSKAALDGARAILMEQFAESAELIGLLRDYTWQHGVLTSTVAKDKTEVGEKFRDYFAYQEAIKSIPSHRALALFRGRNESVLHLQLQFMDEVHTAFCISAVAKAFSIPLSTLPTGHWLRQTVEWAYKIKIQLKLEMELLSRLREAAETEAIAVFQDNLSHLLLAAPAGNAVTMGLDPGLRTGVKVVVIDGTGKLLTHTTIFPHAPQKKWQVALATLQSLCAQYQVRLISVGNGTASRETEKLCAELIKSCNTLQLTQVMVSEAGASVYSASETAAKEFPDLDVSFRGAVSIARRLQDPLAELVKIDPKSIGVGQYQHDVNQVKLNRSLAGVVEDCVNAVGADVNTASSQLLTSISGLNKTIADNIVAHRETHGRFCEREQLKQVARLGEKTFEQSVGFLRIINGNNPLDASAVHPESYPLVDQVLTALNKPLTAVMGNESLLQSLSARDFVSDQFGLPTVVDVLAELAKPGRDPRGEFKTAQFAEGIDSISDLQPGMKLEGVISNVANFGAFVDIGVHQDGLVHISQLSDQFVSDIHKHVKVGQIVQVRVLEIDAKRKRISLTMKTAEKLHTTTKNTTAHPAKSHPDQRGKKTARRSTRANRPQSLLADQLKKALH